MEKTFKIVNGDMSDGYHTFDELYEHRCLLFLSLCNKEPTRCAWKTDESFGDWFCLYMETSHGQISYHIPSKLLPILNPDIPFCPTYQWDGHTSDQVIGRLIELAKRS